MNRNFGSSFLYIVFIIDKSCSSQPAQRDFYPRFVRPFAARLVDKFVQKLFQYHQYCTVGNGIAFGNLYCCDLSVAVGVDVVFHLHGFEHNNGLSF